MSVNTAGVYKLNFTTDLDLPGETQCLSTPFSVEIGKPSKLIVLHEPNESTVYGGKAFDIQSHLIIVDDGDNVVKTDSTSNVVISLYSNPSNASLSPLDKSVAIASEGMVQFMHLSIDKAGVGYRMSYELFLTDDNDRIIETNITTLGKTS